MPAFNSASYHVDDSISENGQATTGSLSTTNTANPMQNNAVAKDEQSSQFKTEDINTLVQSMDTGPVSTQSAYTSSANRNKRIKLEDTKIGSDSTAMVKVEHTEPIPSSIVNKATKEELAEKANHHELTAVEVKHPESQHDGMQIYSSREPEEIESLSEDKNMPLADTHLTTTPDSWPPQEPFQPCTQIFLHEYPARSRNNPKKRVIVRHVHRNADGSVTYQCETRIMVRTNIQGYTPWGNTHLAVAGDEVEMAARGLGPDDQVYWAPRDLQRPRNRFEPKHPL